MYDSIKGRPATAGRDALQRLAFLARLPEGVRKALLDRSYVATYPAKSLIFGTGSEPRPGVIVAGLVRMFVVANDGREATLRYARPGEAIGLVHLFVAEPEAGFQAVGETSVLHFDSERFQEQMTSEPTLSHAVARQLAGRFGCSPRTLQGFAFGTVRQRLAENLLHLASRDEDGQLVAHVTHQDLADAVGSVREVVARELGRLRAAGLVATSHSKVTIKNERALRREAGNSDPGSFADNNGH
jgi:CRP/FNR family transcriptional regulator, cyclic AMP receptor protein